MVPKTSIKEGVWILTALAAIGFVGYYLYHDRARVAGIRAVMTGRVRANTETFIYHVPTCPQYESVAAINVREFTTADDAEQAGFRPAMNCDEAISIRKINESGAYSDGDPHAEDPRQ